ncbi:histone H1.2-like [Latimeria chalumnae]|uniref:histone H1.2-like n=1 Tax=Latimeria chalumnae TaxID=7897 RepID=UPI0003C17A55|nr:PREDICTED: histone H1.2-like [Latimeria chalumnae]|eukprot:XP_006014134.1 PREDICTED: histone H1.2-like [Latimeria chalumnae]
MTEVAPSTPAALQAAPMKALKKKKVAAVSKSKKSPSGPPVSELVMKIVAANKERKGVSLAALKKALESGGYDVKKRNNFLKQAVRRLVEKGMLLQVKGCGASGSFKVNKPQQQQVAKKAVKKTAVSKVKKPAVKKRSSAGKLKKPAAASKKGKSAKSAKAPAAAAKKPAKSAKKAKVAKPQKKALKPKPVKPKKKIPKKGAPKK